MPSQTYALMHLQQHASGQARGDSPGGGHGPPQGRVHRTSSMKEGSGHGRSMSFRRQASFSGKNGGAAGGGGDGEYQAAGSDFHGTTNATMHFIQ